MGSVSLISLLSALMSLIALFFVFYIFRKVYDEDYKKPWLFIGISALFIILSELIKFSNGFMGFQIVNPQITEVTHLFLSFIAISFLTYGLFLEYVILKYFHGKFVKIRFTPVQENSTPTIQTQVAIAGPQPLILNIEHANAYLSVNLDRHKLIEGFADATRKGYEGFLIVDHPPKDIRSRYNLQKTPIAWLTATKTDLNQNYIKSSLDDNSDILDSLHINSLITYIDDFVTQSKDPLILVDLNPILKVNNAPIVIEFMRYISQIIKNKNGVLICTATRDHIDKSIISEFEIFMKELA